MKQEGKGKIQKRMVYELGRKGRRKAMYLSPDTPGVEKLQAHSGVIHTKNWSSIL